MEKLIKNIDKDAWNELKEEAARHRMRLGAFLAYIVKEHKRIKNKEYSAWNHVLKGKKCLNPQEAVAIRNSLKVFEQEYNFER